MKTGINVVAEDQRSFAGNLDFYEVTPRCQELIVRSGQLCTLDTTPGAVGAVRPRLLATRDLDQLKAWIGVPDRAYESGELPQRAVPSWSPWLADGSASEAEESATADALSQARQAYVHGYSKLIERGKPQIEEFFGEFRVACFAIRRVVVEPQAGLVVQGSLPAVLIIGEFCLGGAGALRLFTETRMCVDQLVKSDREGQVR
jgi:hypothetical protein